MGEREEGDEIVGVMREDWNWAFVREECDAMNLDERRDEFDAMSLVGRRAFEGGKEGMGVGISMFTVCSYGEINSTYKFLLIIISSILSLFSLKSLPHCCSPYLAEVSISIQRKHLT